MARDIRPLTQFVNAEIPKRLSTEINPTTVREGLVPISTGSGLSFDLVDPAELGGLSAYEIAVNAGFEGTVEEWLLSLKANISLTDLNVGIVTHHNLPLSSEGTVELPQAAYGGILMDMALVHLNNDTVVEVIGVTLDGLTLSLSLEDMIDLDGNAESVTVSYLGDL